MARRSSQRIRNRNSSTPKRVSLSHDAPSARTPRTAPVKLSAVREDDFMPGAFPSSISPPPKTTRSSINQETTTVQVKFDNSTPRNATPIQPSDKQLNPKKHQHSTAKPLDEVRWLGFSNMAPHTAPPKQGSNIAMFQDTPSRSSKSIDFMDSPRFQFSLGREVSHELSPEAKRLMLEKREEANRIREQMLTSGSGASDATINVERKIATSKGKKGRFSEAHNEEFMKMDSIASHPSTYRSGTAKVNDQASSSQTAHVAQTSHQILSGPSKSLKRSPSKAQLDGPDSQHDSYRQAIKTGLVYPSGHLPRSASSKSLHSKESSVDSSPSKRIKRAETDDVSRSRPASGEGEKTPPAQLGKDTPKHATSTDMSTYTTPTRASVARASSVKSTKSSKIPAPAMQQATFHALLVDQGHERSKANTPLLAKSPAKKSLFANHGTLSNRDGERPKSAFSPLLMRSPFKISPPKKSADSVEGGEDKAMALPFLSRTPLKMSVTKSAEPDVFKGEHEPTVPLLAQSPSKIPLAREDLESKGGHSHGKFSNGNIMGRFNLLRTSPIKSILRSPQRLYSDDPAKIAAGTHFASPSSAVANKNKPLPDTTAGTTSPEKHVDFTSSTKARYERAQSEAESTPSKGPTPPSKHGSSTTLSIQTSEPPIAKYPTLPTSGKDPEVTPQKRRQTAAPFDFTFTSHGSGIVFGQSPSAPASVGDQKRPSTIRHVSAEPQFPPAPPPAAGAKKRKYEFENEQVGDEDIGGQSGALSDKENASNDQDERPSKRMKPSAKEPAPTKPATRLPTLGVGPKKTSKDGKDARPKTISKAKLNALAQPKRRA